MNAKHFFAAAAIAAAAVTTAAAAEQITAIYFSPHGETANAIAATIDNAKAQIAVTAYAISEQRITASLIAAHQRGVEVKLLVDRHCQDPHQSTAGKIKKAGVETMVDRVEKLQHNKSIIIDDRIVITGSYNFTEAAERQNAENAVIIDDPAIAKRYLTNFSRHWDHSTQFVASPNDARRRPRITPTPPQPPQPPHEKEP